MHQVTSIYSNRKEIGQFSNVAWVNQTADSLP